MPVRKPEAKQLASGGPTSGQEPQKVEREKLWVSSGKTFEKPEENEEAGKIAADYIKEHPEWELTGNWKHEKADGVEEATAFYEVQKTLNPLPGNKAMGAVADSLGQKFDAKAAEAKAEESKVPPSTAEGQPETNKMMDTVAEKLKKEVEAGNLELKEDSPVK